MSAVVGTLPDVLTLALAVDVFNIIEGVLHDTLFESQFNDNHSSSLAAMMPLLQVPVPTLPSNTISSVRIVSPVVFVPTVSLSIATRVLRSVCLFKRASLVPYLWIINQNIEDMLPGTEKAQQWVWSLNVASALLKNVSKLCTFVVIFLAAMLPASASAAPTSAPVEKDVTCIVTNITLASDCPIENTKYLTPEAKGLIALGAVTAIFTFILVVLGVPQRVWRWFRRPVHTTAEPVGDDETDNATAGGTVPEGHAGRLGCLFRHCPRLNLFGARGARYVPDRHTPRLRNELLHGAGQGLDGEPTERPEVIDDNGLELDDLVQPMVSPPQTSELESVVSPPQTPQLAVEQHNIVPSVIGPEPQKHDDPKALSGKSNTH